MSNRIGQPPPTPQPREVKQADKPTPKKTDETTARGAQAAATVQMESLAARVKGGKAVAGSSLMLQHSNEAEAAQAPETKMPERWTIAGLLEDNGRRGGQGQDGGGFEESLPEIPLIEIPYDVVDSPLGRAYRAVLWLKAFSQMEQVAKWLDTHPDHQSTELSTLIADMRELQDKRRAVMQIEGFFRSERQRLQLELNKERAALLANGKDAPTARIFGLPSAALAWPPILELGTLDGQNDPADFGGGTGTIEAFDVLLQHCAEKKLKLVDETVEPEKRWAQAWSKLAPLI